MEFITDISWIVTTSLELVCKEFMVDNDKRII